MTLAAGAGLSEQLQYGKVVEYKLLNVTEDHEGPSYRRGTPGVGPRVEL